MGLEGVLNQIFQPYFYYSVIFLCVTFVCVRILTKYCSFMGQKAKSFLYLIPLSFPLAVMLIASPSTVIATTYEHVKMVVTGASQIPFGPFPLPTQVAYQTVVSTSTVLSVTGIICIIGLVAGAVFAVSMLLANDWVARRVLHVILLSPEDHRWLQAKITEASARLAIATPKIGVVEDLRPNAFTIGYGSRATVVFSVGLLNLLNKDEIVAVASHELAHVKNGDFFFKTISNALAAISFFNPLSYISSSTAQREREMLADERAVDLLPKPSALADALAKICRTLQNLPKEGFFANVSSNLLVSGSVLHRVGILSTHPRLDTRLRNISAPKPRSRHWGRQNTNIAFLLSLMLILSTVAVGLAMADLQLNFNANFTANLAHSQYRIPSGFKGLGYDMGQTNGTIPLGVVPPINASQNMHLLIYQPGFPAGTPNASPTVFTGPFGSNYIVADGHLYAPLQSGQFSIVQAQRGLPGANWIG